MTSFAFSSILLIAAAAVLLYATRVLYVRVQIGEDFALARRRLSAVLVGLSQAINCVPMWLLMALMLLAYSKGLAAVWMALANLLGLAINWWIIAPQLRTQTTATGSFTLSQWFAASTSDNVQMIMRRSATAIVVFSIGFATLTFLQWAGQNLASMMDSSFAIAVLLLVLLLLSITVFAGLWSSSVGDVMQAGVIFFMLLIAAVCALFAVGGCQALWSGIATREPIAGPWFGGYSGVLAIALVVGVMFAAVASAAQPQVVSRYLACRDDTVLRRARWIAMAWSALVLLGALMVGWCARLLLSDATDSRTLMTALVNQTMPGALASMIAACMILVFALACASPWVAVATHLAIDLRNATESLSLMWCRVTLIVFGLAIGCMAIYLPIGDEDRLWLCWQSLSAAFGPLLLVRLTGKKVRPGSSLGAMWSGFVLTVLFHLMPDTPGDLLERTLPFIAGIGIALSGGDQRRNPNRADRGDKTVHDHLPI